MSTVTFEEDPWRVRPSRYWGPVTGRHIPTPTQQMFLWLDCLEAMYGGAAGGGKSDALLMAALQYVDVPGYSALLLRRTYPELSQSGGLMSRAEEWLSASDARWNSTDKTWRFPSGATLSFGYLSSPGDKFRYQGAEFQFIGFDELTQFQFLDYTYLFSRLRRLEGQNVPIRMRAASNPGGAGHSWVKKRFITREPMGEEDTPPTSFDRVFVPAKLADNPHIDQKQYRISLGQLDPQDRAQLLEGDWDARPPGNWMIPDHSWISAAEEFALEMEDSKEGVPPPSGGYISGGIDWGEISQGYVIWPLERGGIYVPPSEVKNEHGEPGDFAAEFLANLASFGHPVSDVRYDSAGVQSMRTFVKTARQTAGWEKLRSTSIPFNKYKVDTINYLRFLFRRTGEGYMTRVIGIHPHNGELLRQLRMWERKDDETMDAVKLDDHGPDALVAGVSLVAARHRDALDAVRRDAYGLPDEEAA